LGDGVFVVVVAGGLEPSSFILSARAAAVSPLGTLMLVAGSGLVGAGGANPSQN